ncbi:site-specific DNA-methyltransferase [Anaerotignum faecicola]|nr:site-specific DNA-methyltransferase [Anaerotignum faecicola]
MRKHENNQKYKPKTETCDIKFEKFAALFPSAVTQTVINGRVVRAVDKDILSAEINAEIVGGTDEEYVFSWPGKRHAALDTFSKASASLVPCRSESVFFDETENIYIEGDNLTALKLLQKSYKSSIKMIYIDPPYNTGNDFVYNDRYAQSVSEFSAKSGKSKFCGGRLHTNWLNMMYPRLSAARNLLCDEGVIIISIDDNELANTEKICDEIFGSHNHLGTFIVNSTPNARDYGHIGKMHEFALFYAKDCKKAKTFSIPDAEKKFKYSDENGGFNIHPLYNSNEAFTKYNRPNLYYPFYLYPDRPYGKNFFEIGFEKTANSIEIYPPKSVKNSVQFVWRWGKEKSMKYMNKEITGYMTSSGEYRIVQKMRRKDKIIRSMLTDTKYSNRRGTQEFEKLFKNKCFSFPKPLGLISDFLTAGTDKESIVLDFFAGSSTTAQAVMELNAADGGHRKFIMIQRPEKTAKDSIAYKSGFKNICEIGKERIRLAGENMRESCSMQTAADTGFRVFKLREPTANVKSCILADNANNYDYAVFNLMAESGVKLSCKVIEKTICSNRIYETSEGALTACFEEFISDEAAKYMASEKPEYFIVSSPPSENIKRIFENVSPETKIKNIGKSNNI